MVNEYFLSVVVPIYNEEERIGPSLIRIVDYFAEKDYRYELILVMDGCEDNSAEICKGLLKKMKGRLENCSVNFLESMENHGKGYSVRKGCLFAKGKYVLFMDADLSTPVEEVEKLIAYLQDGFNIAIGSRAIRGADVVVKQSIIRRSMGKIFNFFVRMITGMDYHDTQCGFKCFDSTAVEIIFNRLKIDGFGFDVEILYLAKQFNLKVKEVPVRWFNSPKSKVRIIADSVEMLLSILKIKQIHSRNMLGDSHVR